MRRGICMIKLMIVDDHTMIKEGLKKTDPTLTIEPPKRSKTERVFLRKHPI